MRSAPPPSTLLDRVAAMLGAFDTGRGQMTLAELAAHTGIPRTSSYRILERLVAMKWLQRHGSAYELGPRLMELGSLALQRNSLSVAATPIVHWLHRTTGHVVFLGVLDGPDVLYLERVGGSLAQQLPSRPGSRQPAHRSAIGRSLLASGAQGLAFESSGEGGGINIIAAPIDTRGELRAGISICGRPSRVQFSQAHGAPVRQAAGAIFRALEQARRARAPFR
ncbi:helix-turn-helix domain-containing protein [Prescottella equi]|uniref:Helix-turn-helix domain-containing protein n=1 Tax=Rhodococcus hoagii TaxID=43767 RepID=A0A9Q2UIB4_RHOHA|nr:helix-turn-helix domain-containing protein [Prescottella equi]MBM4480775.1 helix-turn-helix domain-containing protein [Prescottella equi]MBM4489817.1 helix-turn-helix domain-containing protein [Prescottella equi]MBM4495661.1 helix-turn-helix domain-containing protein [Prescottella equi]MBM4500896.1 helix-turn-helix domain-containing protein [Prescottella equi]MBM4502618.1 helix-turn-helix domain-containing protein [Prescottella equi]